MVLATYLISINILSFSLYGQDKLAARGWLPLFGCRIPESLLHQLELIGGSAGAFVAQRMFNHKISKAPYQRRFCHVLMMQLAAGVAWAYLRGPTWAAVGCSGALAAMLTETVLRLRYIDNWQSRSYRKGGVQPWQRPVSDEVMRRRQPHRQARNRPHRGQTA